MVESDWNVEHRQQLGGYLKALAAFRGWTQVDVGQQVQQHASTISRLYKGEVVKPSLYQRVSQLHGFPLIQALEKARDWSNQNNPASLSKEGQMQTIEHAPTPAPQSMLPTHTGAMILAVTAQKGGVGKTTTSVCLAHAWAGRAKRVLLVDMDQQGNASKWLLAQEDPDQGTALLEGLRSGTPLQPIASTSGVDVIVSGSRMAEASDALKNKTAGFKQLKKLLAPLRNHYDVIIIDTPPSLGIVTINALVAADAVLIPVQTHGFSLDALDKTMDTCIEVRDELNEDLEILGCVATNFDRRTVIGREMRRELATHPRAPLLDTIIHTDVKVAEASTLCEALREYAPGARGAREYAKLARELEERAHV